MACGVSTSSSTSKLDLSFYEWAHCKENAQKALKIIKAEGLHLVAGSLGMNGHYEYGGKDWVDSDFKKQNYTDAHVWVEDKEGRIYDYISEEWTFCCKIRGAKATFPKTFTIAGMTQRELYTKFKITYKKADPLIQEKIIKSLRSLETEDETYELRMNVFKF